jgi:hypothetical protein
MRLAHPHKRKTSTSWSFIHSHSKESVILSRQAKDLAAAFFAAVICRNEGEQYRQIAQRVARWASLLLGLRMTVDSLMALNHDSLKDCPLPAQPAELAKNTG